MRLPTATLTFARGIVVMGACGTDEVRLHGLSDTVHERITRRDDTPISLARATEFPWDRVFIFQPYTPYEQVVDAIGIPWEGVQRSGIATRDDAVLWVFMRSREIAAFAMYPRRDGDLSEVREPRGLTPEQALFVARRVEHDGPWTVLELASPQR